MSQKKATFIPTDSSPLQEKFICCLMKNGKKSIARKVLKNTFNEIQKQGNKKPKEIFEKALTNVSPQIEVRPKRVGGAVYQIPMEVKPHRQQTLSIRWLLQATRTKKGSPMHLRLATELIEASKESGEAFKKKENVHKMAQANRAFAHLARF